MSYPGQYHSHVSDHVWNVLKFNVNYLLFTMRKRKDLSLSQKLEIVQLASENVSQIEISQLFAVNCLQILSHKEDLINKHDAAENKMKDRKRKRTGKAWFVDARARNVPITTLVPEEKANLLLPI